MPINRSAHQRANSASAHVIGPLRRLADLVVDNPIFLRELRRRMRGRALFVAMISYIALMCAVAFVIVFARTVEMRTGQAVNIAPLMQRMSEELFTWIAVIQGVLVLLVGPIITAGIVTSEKEKRTLDFLQVTTLHPWAFILGALASTMLYILLVLLCALPVLSITFLFGGVSPGQIVASFGSLLLLATILSAAELWIACLRERTRSVQSAPLLILGILVVYFVLIRTFMPLMFTSGGGGSALLPFSRLAPGGEVTIFGFPIRAWHADIAGALFVIGLLALLGARRVFNPENRPLNYWQGLVLFVAIQLFLAALLWGGRAPQPEVVAEAGTATWVVLTVFVLIYNIGRPEMGNEVWRLKRRFPWLRRVDESVLYTVGLLALWAVIGGWWVGNTAAAVAQPSETQRIWSQTLIFIGAVTLFSCALARVAAHATSSRSRAFALTLFSLAMLFVALPLILMFVIEVRREPMAEPILGRLLTALACTPWVYLSELSLGSVIPSLQRLDFEARVMGLAPALYALVAAGLFAAAWLLHRRSGREPDYCLDDRPAWNISERPYLHEEIRAMMGR